MSATGAVFDYYQDTMAGVAADEDWDWCIDILGPVQVWDHIAIGPDVYVQCHQAEGRVYLSIECECGWGPEHGLQIVIREGLAVARTTGT